MILCTSTRIMRPPQYEVLEAAEETELSAALAAYGAVCVGTAAENGKLAAPQLPFETLAQLADYVLVEADGAKRLPLKAHASHEPVIPPGANQTILVAGLSGFFRPAIQSVHRAELFAARLGIPVDTAVTPLLWTAFVNQEALHTRVLLNQADTAAQLSLAEQIAPLLHTPVCAAALQKEMITCLC